MLIIKVTWYTSVTCISLIYTDIHNIIIYLINNNTLHSLIGNNNAFICIQFQATSSIIMSLYTSQFWAQASSLNKRTSVQSKISKTYWSTAGTANVPLGVIMAPGAFGPSTGTIKLRGIPVLLFISTNSA